LQFYTVEELELIVKRGGRVLGVPVSEDGANEIARRARGTPRIAGRLCAASATSPPCSVPTPSAAPVADKALKALEVDDAGLDAMDNRYLKLIASSFGGGPVGVETLAAALSEPRDAIEDIIEPYLIQQGFFAANPARPRADHPRLPASGPAGTRRQHGADAAVRR